MTIDTSPAALRKLADRSTHPLMIPPSPEDFRELVLTVAAEKEVFELLFAVRDANKDAKEAQQPVADVPVHPREGMLWANVRPRGSDTPVPSYPLLPLYLTPQHHPEQPLEMVASADVPLPEPDYPAGSSGMLGENCFASNTVLAHREAYAKEKVAAVRELLAQRCEQVAAHKMQMTTREVALYLAGVCRRYSDEEFQADVAAQKGTV